MGNKIIFMEMCFVTLGTFVPGSCRAHSSNSAMQVAARGPGVANWLSQQHNKYCWRIALFYEFMFLLG